MAGPKISSPEDDSGGEDVEEGVKASGSKRKFISYTGLTTLC